MSSSSQTNDLKKRIIFTIFILAVYRFGTFVPIPGIDPEQLQTMMSGNQKGLLGMFNVFSGGAVSRMAIFALGIMPYISSSIIVQLLTGVSDYFKNLKAQGETGRAKITQITRYGTVVLATIQGYGLSIGLQSSADLVINPGLFFTVTAVSTIVAGTMFLMWLGEQIDKYGIGNGVSLILTAGIIARMPNAVTWVWDNFSTSQQSMSGGIGILGVLFLIGAFVFVVAGAIVITVAQRRIPIQQARHTRGRKVYGGGRHYLPLRVNHAGVMPIIFASSLLIFPSAFFGYLQSAANASPDPASWWVATTTFLNANFQMGEYPYIVLEIILIYFFSYFWTTIVFSPEDMARQLRDNGSFIPGLRPGPRTAEYLETVVERITYVGAGFLAIIAVIPSIVSKEMQIPFLVSSFLGGTGLLIVVSVGLDLIQRIEANLLMRNYKGFFDAQTQSRTGRATRKPSGA